MISNASDALDKIRFLSLTDKSALSATDELSVKIKVCVCVCVCICVCAHLCVCACTCVCGT